MFFGNFMQNYREFFQIFLTVLFFFLNLLEILSENNTNFFHGRNKIYAKLFKNS